MSEQALSTSTTAINHRSGVYCSTDVASNSFQVDRLAGSPDQVMVNNYLNFLGIEVAACVRRTSCFFVVYLAFSLASTVVCLD